MSEVNLIKYETRNEWLAARTLSIGASESAALFDLSPDSRESEFSLWAKKTGLAEPEQIDAEWLEWGQLLEAPIAERYAKRTGCKLWTPPTPWCVAVHPRLPFMTATVDRWIIEAPGREDRGDLEIKNVGAFNSDWRDEVPLYIQAQVQHQLAVTGFKWGVVAALIGGNKMETIEIERNPEFIAELEAKAIEFWDKVQRKEAPPVDGKAATARTLKLLHPSDNGATIALDSDVASWVDKLAKAKEDEKAAEAAKKEAENHIKATLGPNTFGTLPDGRIVSLKTQARAGYTVDPCEFRTLRVSKKGKAA
jgi:putative phage-type endonuclease